MTEAENKLFFLPNENLTNALRRGLSVLTPYSTVLEALDEMAPRLAGAGRNHFLMSLHSLAKLAEREEVSISEIGVLLEELLETIEGSTLLAEDEEAADFIDAMKEFLYPTYVAARQLARNGVETMTINPGG